MSNTITRAVATSAQRHVAAAQPAATQYQELIARSRTGAALTGFEHRVAEALCIEIAAHFHRAANASTDAPEYRRWRWCANQVRATGERHALWADLADYADQLVEDGRPR